MDKLIKDIEKVISDNLSYGLFEDMSRPQGIALFLSSSLRCYKTRRSRKSKPVKEISSNQWHQINLLVDCARDRWRALGSVSDFYDDAYCRGYINAVLRVMDIFGIDEKRVKK